MHVESWQSAESSQFGLIFPGRLWKVPHHSSVWSLTLISYLQSPWPLASCSPSWREVSSVVGCHLLLLNPCCYSVPRIHCPSLSHASHIAPFQKQLELDLPLVHFCHGEREFGGMEGQGRLRHFSQQVQPCSSSHLKEDGHLLCPPLSEWQTAQKENLGSGDNWEIILDLEPKSSWFTSWSISWQHFVDIYIVAFPCNCVIVSVSLHNHDNHNFKWLCGIQSK